MRYFLVLALAAFFSAVALTAGPTSSAHADPVDTALYGSGDTLVITDLGINAPVNVRNVSEDGTMGDPGGKDDVVRYDFPTWPGYGGYPGKGGTTVVAGHVDYHPNFQAVFWTLKQAYPGMKIYYYTGDNKMITYAVDWVSFVGGEDDVAQYLVNTTSEAMVLISCEGSFDPVTRHYNNRTMVYATRVAS